MRSGLRGRRGLHQLVQGPTIVRSPACGGAFLFLADVVWQEGISGENEMIKISAVFSTIAICLLLTGCGSGANDCDKADDIQSAGISEGCAAQSGCCYCDCFAQGKFMDPQAADCSCIEATGGSCSGASLDAARECLADEATCKSNAKDLVASFCD